MDGGSVGGPEHSWNLEPGRKKPAVQPARLVITFWAICLGLNPPVPLTFLLSCSLKLQLGPGLRSDPTQNRINKERKKARSSRSWLGSSRSWLGSGELEAGLGGSMAPGDRPIGHGDSFQSGAHSAAPKCVEVLSSLP